MSNADSQGKKPKPDTDTDFEELVIADADRVEAQANTNAVSRAIAVTFLMLIPGVLGSYVDNWLGTQIFVLIGFSLGIGIAIYGLLYVARISDLAAKKSRELRTRAKSEQKDSLTKKSHE